MEARHGAPWREKMRKVVEWKRRNADNSTEVQFLIADDYHAGFSVEADGVTWRVVNVPEVGHMFVEEA